MSWLDALYAERDALAGEVERLIVDNQKLRAALKRLHDAASDGLKDDELVKREKDWWRFEIRAAAAALKETGDGER